MAQQYGDRWRVISALGEGGQAHTFVVEDLKSPDRARYALKRLKNVRRLGRFEKEIEVLSRLSHENVIRVVDASLSDAHPYFVSEFCPGGDLEKAIPRLLGHPDRAVAIFLEVCAGVSAAHRAGVTHRDIKPANVLLRGPDGPAVVADFGICYVEGGERHTLVDEPVGPRFFIAPELEDGRVDEVSPSSDIYSLGKLLYWLLSGATVFSRERHREATIDLVRTMGDPRYERVNQVLDKMIAADPAARFQNVDDIIASATPLVGYLTPPDTFASSKTSTVAVSIIDLDLCGQPELIVLTRPEERVVGARARLELRAFDADRTTWRVQFEQEFECHDAYVGLLVAELCGDGKKQFIPFNVAGSGAFLTYEVLSYQHGRVIRLLDRGPLFQGEIEPRPTGLLESSSDRSTMFVWDGVSFVGSLVTTQMPVPSDSVALRYRVGSNGISGPSRISLSVGQQLQLVRTDSEVISTRIFYPEPILATASSSVYTASTVGRGTFKFLRGYGDLIGLDVEIVVHSSGSIAQESDARGAADADATRRRETSRTIMFAGPLPEVSGNTSVIADAPLVALRLPRHEQIATFAKRDFRMPSGVPSMTAFDLVSSKAGKQARATLGAVAKGNSLVVELQEAERGDTDLTVWLTVENMGNEVVRWFGPEIMALVEGQYQDRRADPDDEGHTRLTDLFPGDQFTFHYVFSLPKSTGGIKWMVCKSWDVDLSFIWYMGV